MLLCPGELLYTSSLSLHCVALEWESQSGEKKRGTGWNILLFIHLAFLAKSGVLKIVECALMKLLKNGLITLYHKMWFPFILCFNQNKGIHLEENKTLEKCPKIPFVRVGIKDINGNNIQATSSPEYLLRKSKIIKS